MELELELELASYSASSWMMILTLSRDTLNCTFDVNDNATILQQYSCSSSHTACNCYYNCNCFPSNDITQCIFQIQIHYLTLISFISGLTRCLLSMLWLIRCTWQISSCHKTRLNSTRLESTRFELWVVKASGILLVILVILLFKYISFLIHMKSMMWEDPPLSHIAV